MASDEDCILRHFLLQARLERANTLLRLGRVDDAEKDFMELVIKHSVMLVLKFMYLFLCSQTLHQDRSRKML